MQAQFKSFEWWKTHWTPTQVALMVNYARYEKRAPSSEPGFV